LAISPDGKTYVTMGAELRDTYNGQVLSTLSGHTDDIWSAAFSKDGKMLITGSKDNTARVWDVASGKLLLLLSGHNSLVSSVVFSPDGTKVLTGSNLSNEARLWEITGNNQQQTFFTSAGISASALAPDGKTILVGDVEGNSGLWDLSTGKELHNFRNCMPDVKSVAFSPDGNLVAIPDCYQGNEISFKLYDPSKGAFLNTFSTTSSQPFIASLTFSSDSKMIFATYQDSTSRLWDIASGQILRLFNGNDPDNHTSAYSSDGKLVTRGVNFWVDISNGIQVDFPGTTDKPSPSVFSGDGSFLAISDQTGNVTIWRVSPKQSLNYFLSGHTDKITSLAFSPDNKLLLTGSADKTARLWDITSGQLLRVFSGHTAAVTSVAFTPDGKKIVTTSLDKSVRTWITDYNDLLAYACSRVGRDLTLEERTHFGITDQEPTCPQFGEQSQPLLPTTTPMPTPTPMLSWTPCQQQPPDGNKY
jgi:WD40 repeat protein